MSEDKEYNKTFPGIFAIGSMVKADREDKQSELVKKPRKKATIKKKVKKTKKSKRDSVTKYAKDLIY